MPHERLDAGGWLGLLDLPQPNLPREAPAGEQAPIRTPGDRIHRIRMWQRLEVRATLGSPEPDGRIISPAGKQASIGSKRHTVDTVRMPACPEQGATGYLPQLDAAIIAPAGQSASIRAESDGRHNVSMGLPDPVQGLARLLLPLPHPHFSPLAGSRPVLSVAADGHCPAGIEGLSKDALTHQCPGQSRVLHLDALQIHPAQR